MCLVHRFAECWWYGVSWEPNKVCAAIFAKISQLDCGDLGVDLGKLIDCQRNLHKLKEKVGRARSFSQESRIGFDIVLKKAKPNFSVE